jgi:hypothetical protein
MRIVSFVLLLVATTISLHANHITIDYEKIAHRVTLQTGRTLYERYKLEPIGFGGGMMQKVQHMSLSIRTYEPLSVDQARRLTLECLDLYTQNIRNEKELQEFLIEKPYPEKRVELMFYVLNKDNTFQSVKSLANFYVDNGKIFYKIYNEKIQDLEKVQDETIEQARQIVKEQAAKKK